MVNLRSLPTLAAIGLCLIAAPLRAQVPPPVPALADAERRTQYSISATTCACSVNFPLFGSGTDVDSWIEVWIGATRYLSTDPLHGWALSSATGTLATIPRPITNAVLTFNAVQTGAVQIVGAERPRRLSQFSENRGVAARDLNQAISDLVAVERELWDKTNDVTGRAVLAPPGETMSVLVAKASRQNLGACFDANGNLTACAAVPSTTVAAGNGISFAGTNPTTITNNIAAGTGISITGTNPLTLAAAAVPNSALATEAANTVKCNPTGSGAVPQDCTPAQMALATGAWFNARLAKTAAYTVAAADCGTTIALSGNATYALTFSAASGYASNCVVEVINEDAANGKALNINGLSGAILWPLQPITIFAQNNVWQRDPAQGRWKLPSSETLQVNHASGTDTLTCTGAVGGVAGNNKCPNDCLTTGAGACATIQNAVNTIAGQWDCQNNAPTIQLAAESFSEAVVMRGMVCPGYLQIFITGVPATPTNVNWTCPTGLSCLSVRDYAIATVNGVNLIGGGAGSIGLAASQFGDIDVLNISFGNFTSGYGWQITDNGNANCNGGTYAVTGNFITHWFLQAGGAFICSSQAISVPNALTYTNWLQIIGTSYIQLNGSSFSGTGSAAGSTGQKYNISQGGVANTSGVLLPGASAGAISATGCSAGGCYN